MAGAGESVPSRGRGGRKTVDFNVNLVPTIDLLSVLIAFLLITAVWTQVARLRANQMTPPATSSAPTVEEARRTLIVRLTPGRATVGFSDDAEPLDLALDRGAADPAAPLRAALSDYVRRAPVPAREQAVKLQAADGVDYRSVVAALDALADHRLTAVRVGPLTESPGPNLGAPVTRPFVPRH